MICIEKYFEAILFANSTFVHTSSDINTSRQCMLSFKSVNDFISMSISLGFNINLYGPLQYDQINLAH